MSAFLGPIHYWLYKKIQFQDELTRTIITNYPSLISSLNNQFGVVETAALEEVIDGSNIHGWLQAQIIIAEERYAGAVTGLLKEEKLSLDQVKEMIYNFGKNYQLKGTTATELYKELQDLLLDGMPCDHVNLPVEQNETIASWKRTADLHSLHWEKLGSDGSIYYDLRNILLEAMLSSSPYTYKQEDDLCIISK
ncbi:MAG: hypothetical protein IKW28_00665 [Lachnospiraceae bacterium]|nr:hypothetical protein [Lachnospiraceae bacterium]